MNTTPTTARARRGAIEDDAVTVGVGALIVIAVLVLAMLSGCAPSPGAAVRAPPAPVVDRPRDTSPVVDHGSASGEPQPAADPAKDLAAARAAVAEARQREAAAEERLRAAQADQRREREAAAAAWAWGVGAAGLALSLGLVALALWVPLVAGWAWSGAAVALTVAGGSAAFGALLPWLPVLGVALLTVAGLGLLALAVGRLLGWSRRIVQGVERVKDAAGDAREAVKAALGQALDAGDRGLVDELKRRLGVKP